MKIQPEILKDGRVIFHLVENDGTPVQTTEMQKDAFASVVSVWINKVLDAGKAKSISLTDEDIEIIIARRQKPKPQETEKQ